MVIRIVLIKNRLCVRMSNYHVMHLKYIQFLSVIPQKVGKKGRHNSTCWQEYRQVNPYTFDEDVEYFHRFENSLAVSYNMKHTFTYDPAISLLVVTPRKINIYYNRKMGM